MNDGIKQLLVGLLLLGAGLISPSNGLDDKIDREPLHMLIQATIIMFAGLAIYFTYKRIFLKRKYNVN